jgi:dihydroorotate dehydrogenase (fumarate)
MGQVAMEFAAAGADALVLFNRYYQPDIDLAELRLLNDLELSRANEIRLPLLWIAVLSGRIETSLAASTGVEDAEQVIKYLLAGAHVVMTTSALLRNGPQYVEKLLASTLVTGPSATADIEGVLIHGAQGVRSLTVVMVSVQ